MNKAEKKEIRRALSGRVEPAEDGRLWVLPAGDLRILGISDGADAVRLFGVSRRARCYETKNSKGKMTQLAKKCMQNIGRGLVLREQPETPACRIHYLLTPPVVLTFRYEQELPVLTAWTGRGLTGWISLRRAIRAFEKQLPEELRLSGKKAPKEPREKRQKEPKERKRKGKGPTVEKPAEKTDEGLRGNDRQNETEGNAEK